MSESSTADDLLAELKRNVIRPDFPVADLLRACLLLGSELSSTTLREWATQELNGYQGADVPEYRIIGAQLRMDYIYGPRQVTGQVVAPGNLPDWVINAPHFNLSELPVNKSVDAIAAMIAEAQSGSMKLTAAGSDVLPGIITSHAKEDFFQCHSVYYATSSSEFAAVLGAIRTRLTLLLADLGGPLSGLLHGEEADRMVEKNVYNQHIYSPSGSVAQGDNASASTEHHAGLPVEDLLRALTAVREAVADDASTSDHPELVAVLSELDEELRQETPDTQTLSTRRRKLVEFMRENAAGPAVTQAATSLTTLLGQSLGIM